MKHKGNFYFLIAILVCFGMAGVYGALYFFLQKEVKVSNENEGRILLLQAKDEDVTSQKKLIEETKEKVSTLSSHFIYEAGVVSFLESLEALDTVTGTETTIVSVSVKEGGSATEKKSLTVSLDSEGSFVGVYHLLRLIENLPYEIDVQQTSFSRIRTADELGNAPVWKLTLVFSIVSFIPTSV
jgi:hypothetical protein